MASRPYDVLNSAEAKAEATERSLLHIIKPEIDFDPIADEHSQPVYDKAVENFRRWQSEGWLRQDPEEYYYIYAQTMEGRTQYGLAMCCHFEDYLSGAIKKHELTRPDKEEDRMIHVRNQKANIEPVFFAYPDDAEIDAIASKYGSQFVVAAIDARMTDGVWRVTTHGGKRMTDRELFAWAHEVCQRGAGELLFTSMDHDGTRDGYPCETFARLAELPIPIIASGGAGSVRHIADVLTLGRADAALAASIFHYNEIPIPVLKRELSRLNINVRQ